MNTITHNTAKSILIADCGTAMTRALLIAWVGDQYQVKGCASVQTTHGTPDEDIFLAVIDAVKRLELDTQWQIIGQGDTVISPQAADAQGVDLFIAVTSAGEPLQILLVGLTSLLSIQQAKQTFQSTYACITDQVSIGSEGQKRSYAAKLKLLQHTRSDLIFLVGGYDDGATEVVLSQAHMVAAALKMIPVADRPKVLYAGNTALRPALAEILGGVTDYSPIDNVISNKGQLGGRAQQTVYNFGQLYAEKKISAITGIDALKEQLGNDIKPVAQSFAQTIQYIGDNYQVSTLGIDIGHRSTVIAMGSEDGHSVSTCTTIGCGANAPNIFSHLDWAILQKWLPLELEERDFKNFVWNKRLFPASVPQTQQDMWLETVLSRGILYAATQEAYSNWREKINASRKRFSWDLIIGSGHTLTQTLPTDLAALTLLDGLEPVGISRLILDRQGMCRVMGALASVQPLSAVRILDTALQLTQHDNLFVNLGMLIAPMGLGKLGKPALRVGVEYADRTVDVQVDFGTIEIIPLAIEETARIRVRPASEFSLSTSWDQVGRSVEATINGGVYGIIIDARGRPITYAQDTLDMRRQARAWISSLNLQKASLNLPKQEVEAHAF